MLKGGAEPGYRYKHYSPTESAEDIPLHDTLIPVRCFFLQLMSRVFVRALNMSFDSSSFVKYDSSVVVYRIKPKFLTFRI